MSERADEMLILISERGEVSIGEIKEKFKLKTKTLPEGLFFLIDLGLVKLDKTGEYVRLSRSSKKFLQEHHVRMY